MMVWQRSAKESWQHGQLHRVLLTSCSLPGQLLAQPCKQAYWQWRRNTVHSLLVCLRTYARTKSRTGVCCTNGRTIINYPWLYDGENFSAGQCSHCPHW